MYNQGNGWVESSRGLWGRTLTRPVPWLLVVCWQSFMFLGLWKHLPDFCLHLYLMFSLVMRLSLCTNFTFLEGHSHVGFRVHPNYLILSWPYFQINHIPRYCGLGLGIFCGDHNSTHTGCYPIVRGEIGKKWSPRAFKAHVFPILSIFLCLLIAAQHGGSPPTSPTHSQSSSSESSSTRLSHQGEGELTPKADETGSSFPRASVWWFVTEKADVRPECTLPSSKYYNCCNNIHKKVIHFFQFQVGYGRYSFFCLQGIVPFLWVPRPLWCWWWQWRMGQGRLKLVSSGQCA